MFNRTGIILYTLKYKDCVSFYSDILRLRILFTTPALTCFEFGGSYLMVEREDENNGDLAADERIKSCLRMNVPNVRLAAEGLKLKGIEVDYQEHEWGTVAKFHDPDGNLCAFKDSEKFEAQIMNSRFNP